MALGGGTYLVQNKLLPGAYINFVSASRASATLSDRGTATFPLSLDWGPEGEVFTVENADFQRNSLKLFGHAYTDDALRPLREIFENAQTLHVFRLNTGGVKATCKYAEAKYPGVVGNSLKIVIAKNEAFETTENEVYDVSTYIGATQVDIQKAVKAVSELQPNDYVTWTGSEALAESAGITLTSGTNGTVQDAAYQTYLDKIERFKTAESHREKIQDKFLESSELPDLLAGMQHPIWKAVTEFLVLSGLRFGEFAALKAEDVDIKGQIIHVSMTYDPNNKVETTAKTYESRRDVYMQDELLSVAKELRLLMLRQRMMHGYVTDLYVCAEDGSHVKYYTYNKYLQENALRIIGRRITPHTLRHTHASLLMEQGIGIDTISRRLGHSDSKVTKEIYLHVTERLKEKENEQLKGLKII